MTRRLLTALVALPLLHGVANAQQYPQQPEPQPSQPEPQQPPPGYGPPPGYTPPPQGYEQPPPGYNQPPPGYGQGPPPGYGQPPPGYGQPPPPAYYGRHTQYGYYPPPPPAPPPRPRGVNRLFTLGFGLGIGGLNIVDSSGYGGGKEGFYGLSYNFHLGLGLMPNLILMWDVEGTTSSGNSNASNDYADQADQIAHLAALQWFPFGGRLFLKGGMGVAFASRSALNFAPDESGFAGMGGVGFEILQGWHGSFDVEFTSTWAHYANADVTWNNNGLNFVFQWY